MPVSPLAGDVIELWENSTDSFATATRIWEGTASSVTIVKSDETTRYYWVRARALNGNTSTTEPPNSGTASGAEPPVPYDSLTVTADQSTYDALTTGAASSGTVTDTITPSITVSGGTAPYTYQWTELIDITSGVGISDATIEEPTFSHTGTVSELSPAYAQYKLVVTDDVGETGSVTIGLRFTWGSTL
jgi:hypothetical protein